MRFRFFLLLLSCLLLFPVYGEEIKTETGGEFFYSDPYIMYSIRKALYEDMDVGRFNFSVNSTQAVVEISGEVDNDRASFKAGTIALSIPGVKQINNKITINPALTPRPFIRSDKEINNDVEKKLSVTKRVRSYRLECVTIARRVSMKGEVDSLDAEIAALELARSIEGVESVRSRITIDSRVNDGYIFVATKLLMIADPRINGFRIHINVEDGIIILRGNVDDEEAREIAINKARGIAGSKGVISYIEINEEVALEKTIVADNTIVEEVNRTLKSDEELSKYDIKAICSDGIVTLSGTVDSREKVLAAVEKVSVVPGVRAVKSELEIK
ncbi:MAG TPA: BON domain-containing protein [Candidatus Eremiobacteraeota bacterium]|nr:BON domain-containing protein [Candidatus Eremiobacteraeota bacterium]